MSRGVCQKRKKFYGFITVTEKGQVAIPVELRRQLKIKKGDKLIVIKRNDGDGVSLIKAETFAHFLEKLAKD